MAKKGCLTSFIFTGILLCMIIVMGCSIGKKDNEELPKQDVVILYTNDVHSAVDTGIGYAGLAYLEEYYSEDGSEVLLVDCGDAIQGEPIGTISTGKYIIDIMNEMGYDVAIPGNHEFDYGSERFLELVEEAEFPYISCNFRDVENKETVLEPYTLIEAGGVQVAFVGITTPYTITSSAPAYFQNDEGEYIYSFDQGDDGTALYESVQNAVDEAKNAGADYVIALCHLGVEEGLGAYESKEVIANTTGIDVFLDGHSHSVMDCERVKDKDGEWVLLSQTGTKFQSVGMLLIEADGSISTGLIKDVEEKDADMEAYIGSIQSEFEAELLKVVGKTEVDLTVNDPETGERLVRRGETNMGDLCADAYRVISEADISFLNGGGIRDNIAKGDITYEDILKVHPFGNALCVVETTGQDILDALELGAMNYPNEDGSFLHVSGMSYEINSEIPSSVVLDENGMFVKVDGDYRVQNVIINGEALDVNQKYTLASHDYYIKNAGGGMNMFLDDTLLQDSVMLDNQALMNYISEYLNGVVGEEYANPYGQGRIVIK